MLVEAKPASVCGISLPKFVGMTVSQESADGGLQETPIPIDKSHREICKLDSKKAEVYVHVREFILRPVGGELEVTRTREVLERGTKELQRLSDRAEQQTAAIVELKSAIDKGVAMQRVESDFIDAEAARRLDRLCKCRVFVEYDAIAEAKSLVASLEEGELVAGKRRAKGHRVRVVRSNSFAARLPMKRQKYCIASGSQVASCMTWRGVW